MAKEVLATEEEEPKKAKKKRDPERTNGKPKTVKPPTLPAVGKYDFNSEENREAGEKYFAHLSDLYDLDSNDGYQAVLAFAKWARDTIGWKSFGRIITKGSANR